MYFSKLIAGVVLFAVILIAADGNPVVDIQSGHVGETYDVGGQRQGINYYYESRPKSAIKNKTRRTKANEIESADEDDERAISREHKHTNNLHYHHVSPDIKRINEYFDQISKKFADLCEKVNELNTSVNERFSEIINAVNANIVNISGLRAMLVQPQTQLL